MASAANETESFNIVTEWTREYVVYAGATSPDILPPKYSFASGGPVLGDIFAKILGIWPHDT